MVQLALKLPSKTPSPSTHSTLYALISFLVHVLFSIRGVEGSLFLLSPASKFMASNKHTHGAFRSRQKASNDMVKLENRNNYISSRELASEKDAKVIQAERAILEFLEREKGEQFNQFRLLGWRWHNMSLIREANRLYKLSKNIYDYQRYNDSADIGEGNHHDKLKLAVDYVIGFNLKGMTRVETDIMIPFLQKSFQKAISEMEHNAKAGKEQSSQYAENYYYYNTVADAFKIILDNYEKNQQILAKHGSEIKQMTDTYCCFSGDNNDQKNKTRMKHHRSKLPSNNNNKLFQLEVMENILMKSDKVVQLASDMLRTKNNIIIPAMMQLISEKEQKSTISKIAMTLGVLNTRLHLVGFHEAIADNHAEFQLWKQNIPSVARKCIPMWKRTQYDPRAFVLLEQNLS